MADEKRNVMTEEGLRKLQEQYDYLINVKRKEIINAIEVARGFGDLSENAEYTEARNDQAKNEAAKVISVPGTSEHHLGLAVDIVDTRSWNLNEEQENLPGQKWLMNNCWRYGFILRYPVGTEEQTGIIYEPWHYRYVGTELAEELHKSGLTLDEYLKNLKP